MAELYPFRLRVQRSLATALEEISIAGGYKHDLTGKVFRGRTMFGDNDPMPMVAILEPPLPVDQLPSPEDSATSHGAWDLLIQGFAEDDKQNPTDPAHLLLADVKKRLTLERVKSRNDRGPYILDMKEKITKLDVGPGVVRPPDEISAKAYFWLGITLHMVEDLEDPYA